VPGSHEKYGFGTPIAAPALAIVGFPAATINAAGAGLAPTFSIPARHPIMLPCCSPPFFQ
jgi:hypothetical protein